MAAELSDEGLQEAVEATAQGAIAASPELVPT